ncbi:OmpA/MotB family protein [Alkaliphilus oremlandii]|uniref:OmpA/MotB domain protein n=1 Tax=Alkaliphilus oremlandii (strain OhILAs) TaxID=350688 RepID=A8MHE8_ALKOO|nr:flagellar motor protein MotB [Alkaliphilus oremlandii]ABW19035.1 OmpA/MotB domain protein [Alkaliphilus oremlandii OhILAs]
MARKKQQEDQPAGAPLWMTTYSDMVTLLLCFFVLLFAFSTVETQKFDQLMQSLQNAIGVSSSGILDGGNTLFPNDFIDQSLMGDLTAGQRNELENFRELQETLESYLQEYDLETEVLVSQESRGLMLRFQDNVLFDPGKAELKPRSKEILQDIAEFLRSPELKDKDIRVEGHTDTVKVNPTSIYPTNWELSTGRASNVVRYFIEEIDMDPERFSIAGYGEYQPIAPNDTVENKSKNRRVDIVILRSEYIVPKSQ